MGEKADRVRPHAAPDQRLEEVAGRQVGAQRRFRGVAEREQGSDLRRLLNFDLLQESERYASLPVTLS
jgi:hypothetical protein